MVALRPVEISFYKTNDRQCGRGFDALAQVVDKTVIPFFRKYVVPAAKCICVLICWKLPCQKLRMLFVV